MSKNLRVVNESGQGVTCASCVHQVFGGHDEAGPLAWQCTFHEMNFEELKSARQNGCTWHQARRGKRLEKLAGGR